MSDKVSKTELILLSRIKLHFHAKLFDVSVNGNNTPPSLSLLENQQDLTLKGIRVSIKHMWKTESLIR